MARNSRLARRNIGTREVRSIFVIAVEGKTEKAYFEQFKGIIPKVRVLVNQGKSSSPEAVLQQIEKMLIGLKDKKELRPGDQAWVVMDRDEWDLATIERVWEWAGQRPDRGIAFSNPQFEWWILLHFEDGTGVATQNALMQRIYTHIAGYEKGSSQQLPHTDEQRKQAVQRANKKISEMPTSMAELKDVSGSWTTVHFLVEKMMAAVSLAQR